MKTFYCLLLIPTVLSLRCANHFSSYPELNIEKLEKEASMMKGYYDMVKASENLKAECNVCVFLKFSNLTIDGLPRSITVQSCIGAYIELVCNPSLCDTMRSGNIGCETKCCKKDYCNSASSSTGICFWKLFLCILFLFFASIF
ncbi:uncharacterized protein LOC105849122 [Hydra vulgaris]|uniref:uncharacterized protein LOC105849122 n=1 Tax=Hydra vulgaris TaxID=6087 RepID=UPI0032E9F00A